MDLVDQRIDSFTNWLPQPNGKQKSQMLRIFQHHTGISIPENKRTTKLTVLSNLYEYYQQQHCFIKENYKLSKVYCYFKKKTG